jgi:hypothetical protein
MHSSQYLWLCYVCACKSVHVIIAIARYRIAVELQLPAQAGTLVHTAQSMRHIFYHTFDSSVLKHCAGTTMPCIMLALR